MKHVKWTIVLIAISLWFYACQEDEPVSENGAVEFSIAPVVTATNGRTAEVVFPEGTLLRISLSTSNGVVIHTMKDIRLLKIGDSYFSEPLALPAGNYKITDYLIVSPAQNKVLYAAPKSGSPLASMVSKPLPIGFYVGKSTTTNTNVEVIDATYQKPEAFGYASFGVDIIPTMGFTVSIFKPVETIGFESTTATGYILQGQDTLLVKSLKANTTLYWDALPDSTYRLVVIKDGYARYEKSFTITSIVSELHGLPLSVVLEPSLTISYVPTGSFQDVEMTISGDNGKTVRIDWGDGAIEQVTYPTDNSQFRHSYATKQKYFVSVTGDLQSVRTFSMYYSTAVIDTISVYHLGGLERFALSLIECTSSGVDLSNNHKLTTLDLSYGWMTYLDVSHNPLLTHVDIQSSTFPAAVVNKFIDDVYANAVSRNYREGFINVRLAVPGSPWEYVGPPSPDRIAKLETLVNDYDWFIVPVIRP